MEKNEELILEFQKAQEKYFELIERLAKERIPGVIDPVAAKCGVGEVCHGGTFRKPQDWVIDPAIESKINPARGK